MKSRDCLTTNFMHADVSRRCIARATRVKRAALSDERKSLNPSHPLVETLDALVSKEDANCLLAALDEVPDSDWLVCAGREPTEVGRTSELCFVILFLAFK